MAVEEDIKELRETITTLRDKVSNGVNDALSVSRDLHQKQALLMAKYEVRLESIESQTRQILHLLQGDGNYKGLVGRMDLLEQCVNRIQDLQQRHEDSISNLRTLARPCDQHGEKVKNLEEGMKKVTETLEGYKTKEAKFHGGWVVAVAAFSGLASLIAFGLSVWQATRGG